MMPLVNAYFLGKCGKIKIIGCLLVFIVILDYFGVFLHLFESDFYEDFHYPMEGDIREYIMELRHKQTPTVAPINTYNYSYISACEHKCQDEGRMEQIRLVYIVKSAADNFDKRKAIRNTWGFEARFSDVPIRTVFILGVRPLDPILQSSIDAEQLKYKDLVQANFVDTYYNNTIKTMMGIKWAVSYCPRSKFYFFSDDDMYVSTKNVLRFVRNPTDYPNYLEAPVFSLKRMSRVKRFVKQHNETNDSIDIVNPVSSRGLKQVFDFELPEDVKLFAGFVFVSSPHRHKSSKWYISLSEYRYHLWPPYVTAGAYVLSHEALLDMYYASFYTQHFRFDDIYLGLIAKKADIEPFHNEEFHFYKKEYNVYSYQYVIASHGYSDPAELVAVWNEQKSAGNA